VMALMIGAMIIQGIQPGPSVMTEQPTLFWGLIVSMWIGNLMLLVLNLPLIGLWGKMVSKSDPTVPVTCPISAVTLLLVVGPLALVLSPAVSKKREEAFQEEAA
jgi:putative tricarboxylic transport membrane protein